jgi:hypothetical protein
MNNKLLLSLVALNLGMAGCSDIVVKVNKKGGSSQVSASAVKEQNAGEVDAVVNALFNKLDDTKAGLLDDTQKDLVKSILTKALQGQDLRAIVRNTLKDVRNSVIDYSIEEHKYRTEMMDKITQLNNQSANECHGFKDSKQINRFFSLMKNNDSLATVMQTTFLAKLKDFGDLDLAAGGVKVKEGQKNLDAVAQALALAEFGITMDGTSTVKKDADGTLHMIAEGAWMVDSDPSTDTAYDAKYKDYATKIKFDYATKPSGEKTLGISIEVQKAVFDAGSKKFSYIAPTDTEKSYELQLGLNRIVSRVDNDGRKLNTITARIAHGTNLGDAYQQLMFQRELKWDQIEYKLYRFTLKDGVDDDAAATRTAELNVQALQDCVAGLASNIPGKDKDDDGKGKDGSGKDKGEVPGAQPTPTPVPPPVVTPTPTPTPGTDNPADDDNDYTDGGNNGGGKDTPPAGPGQNQNQNQNQNK